MPPEKVKLSFIGKAKRLDAFLVGQLPGLGRRAARELCKAGLVLVNGRRQVAGYILRPGDMTEVEKLPERSNARAELAQTLGGENKINIVYEDEDFLAVTKPRAMFSVTLRAEDPLTLADCIAALRPECLQASLDPREAGLVQRLDYYTSGLVLVAKNRKTWSCLHQVIMSGAVEKTYYALVEGRVASERLRIDLPLQQSNDGKSMKPVYGSDSKSASAIPSATEIETVKVFYSAVQATELTLVRARATKVHRHQIRVHLSAAGYPLLGDQKYGSRSDRSVLTTPSGEYLREGFFLHAQSLSLEHPFSHQPLVLSSDSEDVLAIQRLEL